MNRRIFKVIWRTVSNRQTILIFLLLLGLVTAIVSLWMNSIGGDPTIIGWGEGMLQNFGTEMIGTVITFILFEIIIAGGQRRREAEQRHEREQYDQLMAYRQAKTANQRQQILESMGTDGLLRGLKTENIRFEKANLASVDCRDCIFTNVDLSGCDLRDAHLGNIRLTNATLSRVDMTNAQLMDADLPQVYALGANFQHADMRKINFWGANLRNSTLKGADLRGARLSWANLSWANLQDADLRGANLDHVVMNEGTILPDGSSYENRSQLARFTYTNHV